MTEPKPRGRPRSFDEAEVLAALLATFWEKGFAGTSLDDLSAAAGLNRPSLYAAFGNKQAMYLRALGSYRERIARLFIAHLTGERSLESELSALFEALVDVYSSGPGPARGCLYVCTATAESWDDVHIRTAMAEAFAETDAGFARRFALARKRGELPPTAKPRTLGPLASAVMQSLAARARAGAARDDLLAFAEGAAAQLAR